MTDKILRDRWSPQERLLSEDQMDRILSGENPRELHFEVKQRLVWKKSSISEGQNIWVAKLDDGSNFVITSFSKGIQSGFATPKKSTIIRFRVVHTDADKNITVLDEFSLNLKRAQKIAADFISRSDGK